jgi:predicted GNAT superfamily acetyltransferase
MSLALDWRLRVREAFETCLERGYLVADFLSEGRGDNRRNYYRLSQATDDLKDWVGIE